MDTGFVTTFRPNFWMDDDLAKFSVAHKGAMLAALKHLARWSLRVRSNTATGVTWSWARRTRK